MDYYAENIFCTEDEVEREKRVQELAEELIKKQLQEQYTQ